MIQRIAKAAALIAVLLAGAQAHAETQAQLQNRILRSMASHDPREVKFTFDNVAKVKDYATATERDAATPAEGTIGYALDDNTWALRSGSSWVAISALASMENGAVIANAVNGTVTITEGGETITIAFTTNLATLSSSTGATFAFTPAVAFADSITLSDGAVIDQTANGNISYSEAGEDVVDTFTSNTVTRTSTTGVASMVYTGIGLSTTTSVQSATLVTTTLEADLTAGACTAGTWRVDNQSTRELCRCNDGGTAYDCISVTTANGPTN